MSQSGRARRNSQSSCHPHPDANEPTRRIPYQQLRALVISLIESDGPRSEDDEDDDPDAAEREFDTLPTAHLPTRRSASSTRPPRFRTLDAVLADLAADSGPKQ